jgi:hypothetical protein
MPMCAPHCRRTQCQPAHTRHPCSTYHTQHTHCSTCQSMCNSWQQGASQPRCTAHGVTQKPPRHETVQPIRMQAKHKEKTPAPCARLQICVPGPCPDRQAHAQTAQSTHKRRRMKHTCSSLQCTYPCVLTMHPRWHITQLPSSKLSCADARQGQHPLIWFIKDVAIWALHAYCRSTSHEKLTEHMQD